MQQHDEIILHLAIKGDPVSKKNGMQIIQKGGRPALIQGKRYREFAALAKAQIMRQVPIDWQPIAEPVTVTCTYYRKTNRRIDLVNLLNATSDILTDAGVIQDDNATIIASYDGSRVYLGEKDNPRTEIVIARFPGDR